MKIKYTLFILLSCVLWGSVAQAEPGVIRLFNAKRGFGFVNPESGTTALYFVAGSVLDPENGAGLESGQCVEFSRRTGYSSASGKSYEEAFDISVIPCGETL